MRTTFTVKVSVNLDPVPGKFDNPSDFHQLTIDMFNQMVPHYKPEVSILPAQTDVYTVINKNGVVKSMWSTRERAELFIAQNGGFDEWEIESWQWGE